MVWLQAQAAILLVLFLQQSAAQEAATEGDGSISSAEELRAALLDPGTPAAFIASTPPPERVADPAPHEDPHR